MKKTKILTGGLLIILFLALTINVVIAKPKSGSHGNSDQAQTLLISKDTTTWKPIWPGPFGSLKYNTADASEIRLQVHELLTNEWYMVTFQTPFGDGVNPFKNSTCLWTAKTESWGHWCDVALFRTNDEGNANVIIPTHSGLNPNQYPLLGMNTDPSLSGTFSDVTVVVKYVGDSAGWFDATRLIWGTDPVLFEDQSMETFTIP